MARSTDIEPRAAELLLVELLYGELEADAAAAAERTVAADPELSADAAAFGELRALMHELPDQEPPAAISAQLLHAAAARASAPTATVVAGGGVWGWLQRFFRPFALHPAMAAAASFLLIAGVAGTLYLSGQVDVTERHQRSRPVAPAHRGELREETTTLPAGQTGESMESPALADPGAAEGVLDLRVDGKLEGEVGNDRGGFGAGPAASQSETKPGAGPARANKLDKVKPAPKGSGGGGTLRDRSEAEAPPGGAKGEVGASYEPPSPPAERRSEKDKSPPAKQPSTTDTVNIPIVVPDMNEDQAQSDAPAPQAPPPTDSASSGDEQRASSATEEARRLHATAQRAARDGECQAVVDLGQRVRKLDSRYYDTVFLRDKSLEPCRTAQKKPSK